MSLSLQNQYFVLADTNPTTQVYSVPGNRGMIPNNDAAYVAWINAGAIQGGGGDATASQIGGGLVATSDNGSGKLRVQCGSTDQIQSGMVVNVVGNVNGAYGAAAVTKIDATHFDVSSVAYPGTPDTGGNIWSAQWIDTAASLNKILQTFGLTLIPTTGGFYSVNTVTVAGSFTLSNPLSVVNVLAGTPAAAFNCTMPPSNQPNSVPIGVPFCIVNKTARNANIQTNTSHTNIATLPAEGTVWLALDANSSSDGHFTPLGGMTGVGTAGNIAVLPQIWGGVGEVVGFGDSSFAPATTIGLIHTNVALTAPRSINLPAANTMAEGAKIFLVDLVGGVTATNTLSWVPNGTNTINGVNATAVAINHAYGWACLVTDGGTRWSSVDATDASNLIQGTLPDARLSNTVTAGGPTGDATHVAQITYDAHGRLTAVSSVAITGTAPGGAAGGDLGGTYPNPTVVAIENDAAMAGDLLATNIAAPSSPASGKSRIYVDSTSKNIAVKNDAGTVNHGVQTKAAVASNWIRSIADDGSSAQSQPAFSDISGTASLTTQVTGTLPVANGGTNYTGGAWPAYTATLTPNTGSITQSSNSSKLQVGKLVTVEINETISAISGGPASVTVNLPVAPRGTVVFIGREVSNTGDLLMITCSGATSFSIRKFDNSVRAPALNDQYIFTGVYEAA